MFESKDLKVLLGNSIEESEVDYDSAMVKSEYGHPVEEEALKEYYFVVITENIGKEDFHENYLSTKSLAQKYPLEDQIMLANVILKRIAEVYDFEPSRKFNVDGYDQVNSVYKFIEFLEYDHEDFIVEIWSFLKPETNSFQIEKYCEQNYHKIISEIDEQLDTQDFPWIIADFLRTNIKENIISWFCEKSKNLKNLILLSLTKE